MFEESHSLKCSLETMLEPMKKWFKIRKIETLIDRKLGFGNVYEAYLREHIVKHLLS